MCAHQFFRDLPQRHGLCAQVDRRAEQPGKPLAQLFVAVMRRGDEAQRAPGPLWIEPVVRKADAWLWLVREARRDFAETHGDVLEAVLNDEPALVHEGDVRGGA